MVSRPRHKDKKAPISASFIVSAGKLESINEKTVGESHLKIVQESQRKGYLGSTVVESSYILSKEDTNYCSNHVIHS